VQEPVKPTFAEVSRVAGPKLMKDRLSWLDDSGAAVAEPVYLPPYDARPSDTIRRDPGEAGGGEAGLAGGAAPLGGSAAFGGVPAAGASAASGTGLAGSGAVARVRAIRCAAGHFNPQGLAECRECGVPLDEHQLPEEIDQPSLGVLRRVDTGESWPLSQAIAVIGREPRAAGKSATLIHTANVSPNVSRIHAEVRLNGWHVEVVDKSTHGTQIINPGRDPVRLERDQPVRILPGAQLVLADDVCLRFEVR